MQIDLTAYEHNYRAGRAAKAEQKGFNDDIAIAQRRVQDADQARAQAERDAGAPLVRPAGFNLPPGVEAPPLPMLDTRKRRQKAFEYKKTEYQKARDELDALTAQQDEVAGRLDLRVRRDTAYHQAAARLGLTLPHEPLSQRVRTVLGPQPRGRESQAIADTTEALAAATQGPAAGQQAPAAAAALPMSSLATAARDIFGRMIGRA